MTDVLERFIAAYEAEQAAAWTAPPCRWDEGGEYTNAPASEPEPEPEPERGLIAAALARQATRPPERRIDYDRMNRVGPGQKRALNAAVKSGDAEKIAAACKKAVAEWDEIGCWPDAWSNWQRALDDALGWPNHIDIRDL